MTPLSPGHFLIGSRLTALPEVDETTNMKKKLSEFARHAAAERFIKPIIDCRRRERKRNIQAGRTDHFKSYFRITREQFGELHELVSPGISNITTNWKKPIGLKEGLAICLRYLATGESHHTIAFSFRVGRTTVSKEVWKQSEIGFRELWNFPNLLLRSTSTIATTDKSEEESISSADSAFSNTQRTQDRIAFKTDEDIIQIFNLLKRNYHLKPTHP
ncbi:Hypothetical protein CINCED_3A009317 [Cinara cedri]|uniref:Uncharacterized protein n=1 Tax=Cinara cedri TaxID=506608 RepID=A0A5E4MKK7_9HEMI|nr:Hypothetical protein CINCED_3A009317 [Cinara cedri]